MSKIIVGIDLGGTKILAGAADSRGKFLRKATYPTQAEAGLETVVNNIKKAILKMSQKEEIAAIGIGAPGPILCKEGIIVEPPNLPGWKRVPLKKILADEFKTEVYLDNDANAAALGELKFGAGRGCKNFVYLTISTGIGGGIIIDGKLYRGSLGTAGEVGHMVIDPDGPRCGCGNFGCLEALASGTAMAKRAGRKDALEVEKAAQAGDDLAVRAIEEAGKHIGVGIANLVNLLNPELVIIGGGVANMGEMLFKPIREEVKARALKIASESLKIVKAELGTEAGLLGAIALCL